MATRELDYGVWFVDFTAELHSCRHCFTVTNDNEERFVKLPVWVPKPGTNGSMGDTISSLLLKDVKLDEWALDASIISNTALEADGYTCHKIGREDVSYEWRDKDGNVVLQAAMRVNNRAILRMRGLMADVMRPGELMREVTV